MPTNRTTTPNSYASISPKYSDTLTIWQNEVKFKVSANAVDQIPFMLMPVRLETRFIENNSANSVLDELWVRIYPDDILIESPETQMTDELFTVGENYWKEWWASGGDENKRKGAWRALCQAVGPRLAAWLVKKTKPINYPVQNCSFNHRYQVSLVDSCYEVLNWYQDFNYVSKSKFSPVSWYQQSEYLDKLITAQVSRIEAFDINREQHDDVVNCFEIIESEFTTLNDTITLFSDTNQFPAKPDFLGDISAVIADYSLAVKDITLATPNMDIDSRIANNLASVSTLKGNLMAHKFADEDLDKVEKQLNETIWFTNLALKYNEAVTNFNASSFQADTTDLLAYQAELNTVLENEPPVQPEPGTSFYTSQQKIDLINSSAQKIANYVDFYGTRTSLFSSISSQIIQLTDCQELVKGARLYNKRQSLLVEYDLNYWLNRSIFINDSFINFKNLYWSRWYSVDCVEWNVFDHLPTSPVFPNKTGLGSSTWNGKPVCRLLPERFVAIGIKVTQNVDGTESYTYEQIEVGNPVPSPLNMGIDPSQNTQYFQMDAQGNLIIDSSIKWLFDFQSAVDNGMAIKMKLTGTNIDGSSRTQATYSMQGNVFDKLIVLGVKATDPLIEDYHLHPENYESQPLLEDITKGLVEGLFNSHHYSPNGMDILEIGTPTNNTSDKDSGYSYDDISADESFGIEVDKPLFVKKDTYLDITDGQRLADALGIEHNVFEHIQNADKKQISDLFRTNALFFNGTLGHYMQEMFNGVLNYENIESIKKFFNSYVSSRGILPSLRVNNQPYGIYPTTAWTHWGFFDEQDIRSELYDSLSNLDRAPIAMSDFIKTRDKYMSFMTDLGSPTFFFRFKEVLDHLAFEWIKKSRTKVDYVGNPNIPAGTAQEEFMRILGLHSGSVEYYFRLFSNFSSTSFGQTSYFNATGETIVNKSIADFNSSFYKDQINFGKYNSLWSNNNSGFLQNPNPRILLSFFLKESAKLLGDIVDPYPLSESRKLNKDESQNFINDLSRAKLIDVYKSNDLTSFPHSLLFILLRQTHLLSHLDMFQEYLIQEDFWQSEMYEKSVYKVFEHGAISWLGPPPSKTIVPGKFQFLFTKNLADINLSDLNFKISSSQQAANSTKTLSDLFLSYNSLSNPLMKSNKAYYIKRLKDYKTNLAYFKNHPTAKLERLLQEHIDLCSYRLDAWMGGLVNQRLIQTRNLYKSNVDENNLYPDRVKGVYFGAYGWLDNVKPGSVLDPLTPGNQSTIPESLRDSTKTIFFDNDNLGFIHSPSMEHAVTAAILRSGYLSNKDNYKNGADNNLSVSLTSDRVKKALFFVDGIRNGQSFGELLGYQFERGLHEKYSLELDEYIYPIRRKFPIKDDITEPNSALSAEIKKSRSQNVVDGISLIAKVRERIAGHQGSFHSALVSNTYKSNIQSDLDISGIPDNKYACIALELDYLADNIDAVADLAISEGVFQVVKGNYSRASSALDSLSNGQNLSEVEIVNTPRTGHSVNHKIIKNLNIIQNHNQRPSGWQTIELTLRAKAEPSLNFWLADFVPPASLISFIVKYTLNNQDFEQIHNFEDLSSLHPIDLVYILGSNNSNQSELDERIAYFIRLQYNLEHDVELKLEYITRNPSWSNEVYTVAELISLVKHLYLVVNQSQSINSADFIAPSKGIIEHGKNHLGYDFTFHISNLNGFKQDIQTHIGSIDVGDIENISLSDLRVFLVNASKLGVRDAIPFSVIETSGDEIVTKFKEQVLSIHLELTDRLNSLIDKISKVNTLQAGQSGETKILEALEKAYYIVLGNDFKIVPKFKIKDTAAFNQLRSKSSLLTRSPLVLDKEEWFYKVARVRKNMNAYETVLALTERLFDFTPVQYPFQKDRNGVDDYWYGGEFPDNYVSTGDKQSICLLDDGFYQNSDSNSYFCGLLIDEWTEIIPAKNETTGVTFNYDQPNMKPPQAILLAVTPSPSPSGQWKWDNLVQTLLDTQLMYKIRAVEPDHIMKDTFLGQFFPAVVGCAEPPTDETYTNTTNIVDLLFKYSENNVNKDTPDTLDNTRMNNITFPVSND
jgi:hypothetical protein